MKYQVKVPQLGKRKVVVQYDPERDRLELLVDGQTPPPGKVPNQYFLAGEEGNVVALTVSTDTAKQPHLLVNGAEVELAADLQWYQWVWIGLPIVLIYGGGLVGALFGGIATMINLALMRARLPGVARYGASACVSLVALAGCLTVVGMLQKHLDSGGNAASSKQETPAVLSRSDSGPRAGQAGESNSEPVFNVYVDNSSGQSWKLQIDGKDGQSVAAYQFVGLKLAEGKHRFVVSDASGPVDEVEALVPEHGVILVNPGGRGSYHKALALYGNSYNLPSSGSETAAVKDAVIQADFGLLDGFPDSLQVEASSADVGRSYSRSKLQKVLPDPSNAAALAFLGMEEAQRARVYYDAATRKRTAIKALGQEPLNPQSRELLLSLVNQSSGAELETVLAALKPYHEEIAEPRLLDWARPQQANLGKKAAENQRRSWATGLLLQRGKEDLLLADFPQQDEATRGLLVKLAWDAAPATQRKVMLAGLAGSFEDEFRDGDLLRLVLRKEMALDEPVADAVDSYIARIRDERRKRSWDQSWREHLEDCQRRQSEAAPWLQQRLAAAYSADPNKKDEAAFLLLQAGKDDQAREIYAALPADGKQQVLRKYLGSAKQAPSPAALELARQALTDPAAALREIALLVLARWEKQPLAFLRTAWTAQRQLPVEERKVFGTQLWSNSSEQRKALGTQDLLAVIAEAGDPIWVGDALGTLEREREKRGEHFAALTELYPNIAAGENRQWLMEKMKDVAYLEFAKDAEARNVRQLLELGLKDQTPAVRAAALRASLRLRDRNFIPEQQAAEIIAAQEGEKQSELRGEYQSFIIHNWREAGWDAETRLAAMKKLLAVAQDPANEKVGAQAVDFLPNPREDDKLYIDALLLLAQKSPHAKTRAEAVKKISSLRSAAMRPALQKLLHDESGGVRIAAFSGLLWTRSNDKADKTLQVLRTAAQQEKDPKTLQEMERLLRPYQNR